MNKVNTKVQVKFHLDSANWISDSTKQVLKEKVHSMTHSMTHSLTQ